MVRFGIVGFGLHAVKRMMPAFALAKNSKAVALSRRTMEKAKESSAKWNIPLAFDSAAELARSPEVDAVFVTTPNKFHFTRSEEHTSELQSRLHLVCRLLL